MLTGKIAVVTGAGRGIGREIALTLAAHGATVVVNYNGSGAAAQAVAEEIAAKGGKAEAIRCDVSDFAACEAFAKQVLEKYKRIDILVNNAGVTRDNIIMRMTEADYDQVLDGNAGQSNYSASKAGLIGLTKSVARELASRNVQVNAVAPGFIDTDMTRKMTEEAREKLCGQIPMGKIGTTRQIADAVLFLAGGGSDYITGQVLCVDGGMCM